MARRPRSLRRWCSRSNKSDPFEKSLWIVRFGKISPEEAGRGFQNFHKTEKRCGTGNKLLPRRFFFAKKKKLPGGTARAVRGIGYSRGHGNPRKPRVIPNRRGGRRKEHETGQTEPKGLRLRKRHWRGLDRVGRRAGSCDLPGALSACHDRMRAVCHRRVFAGIK